MSVLLIRPMTPETSRSGLVSIEYPINLGYLVSYLRERGVNVSVRDFEVEAFSENDFIETIKREKPAIVGFSCMTPHLMHGASLARLVKNQFPDILTVIGGVHSSAIPQQTLEEFPQFDVIVKGEGERTLFELYQKWTAREEFSKILGIAYRDNGKIMVNPPRPFIEDLDSVPFPDRDLIDIELYKRSHVARGISRKVMRISEVICSRGCPSECIFCASKVIHTRRVRWRSAENVIAELEMHINKYGSQHFSFLDDNFTIKRDFMNKICSFMKSKNVTFDCLSRVNFVDEDKINTMVDSGCRKISFGIESGSPRVLKLLKKGITVEQIYKAFSACKKAKLQILEGTFLVGSHPDETLEDIKMTQKLIHKLKPDIMGISITIPFPGTEHNRILKERGLLKKENWEEFKVFFGDPMPSWELGSIPIEELQKIVEKMISSYFFTPSYILLWISKINSINELKYLVSVGISLIKTKIKYFK